MHRLLQKITYGLATIVVLVFALIAAQPAHAVCDPNEDVDTTGVSGPITMDIELIENKINADETASVTYTVRTNYKNVTGSKSLATQAPVAFGNENKLCYTFTENNLEPFRSYFVDLSIDHNEQENTVTKLVAFNTAKLDGTGGTPVGTKWEGNNVINDVEPITMDVIVEGGAGNPALRAYVDDVPGVDVIVDWVAYGKKNGKILASRDTAIESDGPVQVPTNSSINGDSVYLGHLEIGSVGALSNDNVDEFLIMVTAYAQYSDPLRKQASNAVAVFNLPNYTQGDGLLDPIIFESISRQRAFHRPLSPLEGCKITELRTTPEGGYQFNVYQNDDPNKVSVSIKTNGCKGNLLRLSIIDDDLSIDYGPSAIINNPIYDVIINQFTGSSTGKDWQFFLSDFVAGDPVPQVYNKQVPITDDVMTITYNLLAGERPCEVLNNFVSDCDFFFKIQIFDRTDGVDNILGAPIEMLIDNDAFPFEYDCSDDNCNTPWALDINHPDGWLVAEDSEGNKIPLNLNGAFSQDFSLCDENPDQLGPGKRDEYYTLCSCYVKEGQEGYNPDLDDDNVPGHILPNCYSLLTGIPGPEGETLRRYNTNTGFGTLVNNLFTIAVGAAGILAVLVLTVAGYRYGMSKESFFKKSEARTQAIGAVGGLVFILFIFTFLSINPRLRDVGFGVKTLTVGGFTEAPLLSDGTCDYSVCRAGPPRVNAGCPDCVPLINVNNEISGRLPYARLKHNGGRPGGETQATSIMASSSMADKLAAFHNATKTQVNQGPLQGGIDLTFGGTIEPTNNTSDPDAIGNWIITEAFPPTNKCHCSSCHFNGTCVDIAFRPRPNSASEMPSKQKIINFIEAAKGVGIRAEFEVNGSRFQDLKSINDTYPDQLKNISYSRGEHFSIYHDQ